MHAIGFFQVLLVGGADGQGDPNVPREPTGRRTDRGSTPTAHRTRRRRNPRASDPAVV
ncbi:MULTISPECIES: hypothetical protein [unclassified Streptomyces]|uniref:hypothetical protein n=1 Tax=Streptomyces sp. NPDC055082 TaxID=3365718 RepID=UPI0037D74C50